MRVFLMALLLLVGLANEKCLAQQAESSILVSGALDLAKSDIPGVIRRYQIGTEVNYFYLYNLSFSGGYEFNYARPNQVSLGGRFYPWEPLFLRVRGLIGSESDLSLGAGYTHNLTYRLRLEGMVDYYAITRVVGLRAGIGILIN